MRISHSLRLFASASLVMAVIVIAPAGAYSGHQLDAGAMLVVKCPEGIVQLAQRKGTRLFQAKPSAYADARTHPLEACMETWDSDTHISKKRWREICERQIKETQSVAD